MDAILQGQKIWSDPKTRNTNLNLPQYVKDVLNNKQLPAEFTSVDVMAFLPKAVQKKIKSIRITDLFNKGELKNLVEDTGTKRKTEGKRGPSQIIYRLK